jgi:DeoR family fructose operon transcriptional repressor
MYAEERQQEILRRTRDAGRVDVVTLAEDFSVTMETIRRDLTVLERAGTLRRVHGGAIPVERLGFAKAALSELPADGSIIIDAGSTTGRLVQVLPGDRELTVIVNSPPLATVLATRANLHVVMLGGRVRGRTLATVDDWAMRPLARLRVDVAFMATNGCSAEVGLTTPDPAEAAMKESMISAAQRSVLLVDHTKVGNDYLAKFASLSDISVLITDTGLDSGLAADLAAAGPEVIRV